jgi:hypothetical protein
MKSIKLKKAEENENVIVHRSGLVIHPKQRYIAGSPDGIVSVSTGETGLVEIKNFGDYHGMLNTALRFCYKGC